MTRDIRYLPRPGALVEITQKTIQDRYLLKPSERLNALVVGCLARAQQSAADRDQSVKLHAVATMSNHFHLLASFDTVEHMSRFMCHLKTNLSKEVGRLHDWQGSMWSGRYQSIPVSDEPAAQEERLRYVLSQGAKEGLVLSPRDWPGVHCARALADDEPIRGVWVDRTRQYAARQRSGEADERDFTVEEELRLEPLPCWIEEQAWLRRERVQEMLRDIEAATLTMHERAGSVPLGVQKILERDPLDRPRPTARSPRPRVHAASKAVRDLLVGAFREFVAAYRRAADRLKAGDRSASFPENCYPPRLQFVAPALA